MTQKELLYIEDALGHAKAMQMSTDSFSKELKDPDLKAFVSGLSAANGKCFNQFLSLL